MLNLERVYVSKAIGFHRGHARICPVQRQMGSGGTDGLHINPYSHPVSGATVVSIHALPRVTHYAPYCQPVLS